MNSRFEATWEIHKFLTKHKTAYIRKWIKFFDEYLPEPHAVDDFERAWRAEKRAARQARSVAQPKRKTR
jgi:hypothetical protein